MLIIKAIGTFLFFFVSFTLTWIYVLQKMKDLRSSFLVAFLGFSVYAWFLTEILSLINLLTSFGIFIAWIIFDVVLLIFLFRLYKTGKLQINIPKLPPLQWEYIALSFILFITFIIAVVYPPNNWDSMTYHLPRIEHWLQNKNINHYFTSINRQIISAPFSEILILQGRALSGSDYLANLVQWFAFLGSIIGVSKITGHFNMNRKMQIAAALFFATIPMAILQASSTQTDLVETFFIICFVERFLEWQKSGKLFECLAIGIALGLAILTKGTAYPIAFPFVLAMAVISIKNFRKRFIGACLAALLCLVINFPHFTRNYITIGEPLGVHGGTVSDFSVKSFAVTFFANINSNFAFPIPRTSIINEQLIKIWDKIDANFYFGQPIVEPPHTLFIYHEDIAKNFLHMILIIIAFIIMLIKKQKNLYNILVIGSWCMFAFFIPWQPWITRLQLPLFAISAPVFAIICENKEKCRKLIVTTLLYFSLLPIFLNNTRPLLHIPGINTIRTIWKNIPRDELIFTNRHGDGCYTDACAFLAQSNIKNLGLIIGGDSWEYPLWRYLKIKLNNDIKIVHIKDDIINDNIDALFILNRSAPASIKLSFRIYDSDKDTPLVLIRDMQQNGNNWIIGFDGE